LTRNIPLVNKTILIIAACTWAMGAQAGTVILDSSAASTTNNSGHPTLDIDPNPAWAAALPGSFWISDGDTGDPSAPGYKVVPNGTTVLFSESFFLNAPVTAATLSVMADDTTSVIVNGITIFAADTSPADGFPTCSSQPIGCLTSTREDFTFADLNPYLKSGSNTIQFDVYQENKVSFGLDYAGSISTGQVPEPASLMLLGGGLVLIGLASRLSTKSRASERESNQV
jgi:hypothetical protein